MTVAEDYEDYVARREYEDRYEEPHAAGGADDENVTEGTFRRSWRPVDLSDVLDGTRQDPEPTVGRRTDGCGMFYPGKCHTVSSESEGGKTWFMLTAAIAELEAGNHVVYLDFEDDQGGLVGRMLTLQANPDHIRERFHYIRPEDPLKAGIHQDDLREAMMTYQPTLVVLDGVTEALTIHGLDPNKNDEVAKFGRMLPRALTAFGPAVVSLDHVTKSSETRGRYSIGAVHKLNGLDGAAYVIENRTPFGEGLTGKSTIRIAKDRPGKLRKNAVPSTSGYWFGDFVMTSDPAGFNVAGVEPPEFKEETFKPTLYMSRVMATIDEKGPLPKRTLIEVTYGKNPNLSKAIEHLIADGYLTAKSPHAKLKDWVDPDEEGHSE